MEPHVPHPRIALRKRRFDQARSGGINQWLAIKVTNAVGSMWCAYVFAIICFISLPDAIRGGTGPLIAWICQTFLQLVLLSIIMVGQNVASDKSDLEVEQTYTDAEALLQITDEVHRLLKENGAMTEEIHRALKENTALTEAVCNSIRQRGKRHRTL